MNTRLSLPAIFSDGMILQHSVETPIWGEAPAGAQITLTINGQIRHVVEKNGQWRASLPALKPGGPYTLTVTSGGNRLEIKDILAGEVWIAGGQSNMEWPLKTTKGYRDHIAAANWPQIRFFNVSKLLYEGERDDNPAKFARQPAWRPAVPAEVGEFSAVAYHFARDLHQTLEIPIGIIECNLGGSSASAWIREDWLTRDSDIQSYLDEYNRSAGSLNLEDYLSASRQAQKIMADSPMPIDPEQENDKPWDFSQIPPEIMKVIKVIFQPGPCMPFGHPGSLYANMVATFAPYSVQGVIYYQGESDDIKARIYNKLLTMLIDCWRETFENPDMSFLLVQLAGYGHAGYPEGDLYAIVRDQQHLTAQTVPGTCCVVAMDCGSMHDIHPRNKQPIGQRLALAARANTYGEAIEWSGPVYRSMQIDNDRIILSFDHADSGLVCPDAALQGFRIAGANRRYFEADARIDGPTVVLSSPNVPMPAAASYGWANHMKVNLYNGAGLPAMPFKTDRYL